MCSEVFGGSTGRMWWFRVKGQDARGKMQDARVKRQESRGKMQGVRCEDRKD